MDSTDNKREDNDMATNSGSVAAPAKDFAIEKHQPQALAEMGTAAAIARAQQEVQGAIIVAKRFPRNEDDCRAKLLKACKRTEFAEDAEYNFPRGDQDVAGPSVYLAREAARLWGNIQYGFEVIRDDQETRMIRSFAWDMESNARTIQEDSFRKLIFRKKGGWVEPDERDLRELTNRRAAIGYRNCILQLIPSDYVNEACREANRTLQNKAAQDPDGERKKIVDAFAEMNVMPSKLEEIIGHKLAEASPPEIAKLRGIYKSIRDGNSTIADYLTPVVESGSSGLPADIRRASDVSPETPRATYNEAANLEEVRSKNSQFTRFKELHEQIYLLDPEAAGKFTMGGSPAEVEKMLGEMGTLAAVLQEQKELSDKAAKGKKPEVQGVPLGDLFKK
jgi:hypothetical protein